MRIIKSFLNWNHPARRRYWKEQEIYFIRHLRLAWPGPEWQICFFFFCRPRSLSACFNKFPSSNCKLCLPTTAKCSSSLKTEVECSDKSRRWRMSSRFSLFFATHWNENWKRKSIESWWKQAFFDIKNENSFVGGNFQLIVTYSVCAMNFSFISCALKLKLLQCNSTTEIVRLCMNSVRTPRLGSRSNFKYFIRSSSTIKRFEIAKNLTARFIAFQNNDSQASLAEWIEITLLNDVASWTFIGNLNVRRNYNWFSLCHL